MSETIYRITKRRRNVVSWRTQPSDLRRQTNDMGYLISLMEEENLADSVSRVTISTMADFLGWAPTRNAPAAGLLFLVSCNFCFAQGVTVSITTSSAALVIGGV